MKMYYCKWTEKDVKGLRSSDGIVILYAEIGDDNISHREIGVNEAGEVVHKFPSDSYRYGKYGLFDNQKVIISNSSPLITKEEFEKLWNES